MIDLKPCPFCGNPAKHNDGGNSVYGRFWWAVWCEECRVEMRDQEKWGDEEGRSVLALPPQECFERWNRRAEVKVSDWDLLFEANHDATGAQRHVEQAHLLLSSHPRFQERRQA